MGISLNRHQIDLRKEKLETIIAWSESNKDIRTVLLTSSLVNPLATVDEFSDLQYSNGIPNSIN
ncbi:Streptomycin adenylyltransferase [compost metagenome]